MRRRVIKTLMQRRPFRPFVISVSSGDEFEVRHPEAAYLARGFIAVVRRQHEGAAEGTDMVWIDYRHIEHCQPLLSHDIPF